MTKTGFPLVFWNHDFKIPAELRDEVDQFHPAYLHHLREDTGVTTDKICGTEIVISDGYCGWHDDECICNYSCILVLRNTTDSWVEVEGRKPRKRQPVGTFFLIDVREQHRLNCADEEKRESGVWIGACVNYDERPTRLQCIEDMGRALRGVYSEGRN